MRVTGCAKQSAPFRGNAVSLDDWADKHLFVKRDNDKEIFPMRKYYIYNKDGDKIAVVDFNPVAFNELYNVRKDYAWAMKWIKANTIGQNLYISTTTVKLCDILGFQSNIGAGYIISDTGIAGAFYD